MASFTTELSPEPKEIDKILYLGSDLHRLAYILHRFHDAEIFHLDDRKAFVPEEFEKFDPDLVVCSAECFRSLLRPLGKERSDTPNLTPRRREIAQLVSKGLSNGEIARLRGFDADRNWPVPNWV
jgi:hypothetical protein